MSSEKTALSIGVSKSVSWIHVGDTHITHVGEKSEIDLGRIVDEINRVYAQGGVDFVFIPGDIADDGSVAGYRAVRMHLDRLKLPWFAIVGDHDVHERSFDNFRQHVTAELYGGFTFGQYRFLRLNAFSAATPDSFAVHDDQLDWLEDELKQCEKSHMRAVVLLHCYPSDLKQGGERITDLIRRYRVLLVDMGHTHYNELSNDGNVIYSATRSTGQIEEGPVGYSVTTLDDGVVSWHFVRLGKPALASITYPADERLITAHAAKERDATSVTVRAKIWSENAIRQARIWSGDQMASLKYLGGAAWSGVLEFPGETATVRQIVVSVEDELGNNFGSSIRYHVNADSKKRYSPVDQENTVGSWEERDILGSQLGPNKNGKKW
jgi:3',5'-cyclic-AMP phosphodiesterase